MTPAESKQVLEALNNSLDGVQKEYDDYFSMWRGVTTRQGRIDGLEKLVLSHEEAIEIMKREVDTLAIRKAVWRSGGMSGRWGQPMVESTPTVEVLMVYGKWAMVQRLRSDISPPIPVGHPNYHSRWRDHSAPFVVETESLDFEKVGS